MPKKHILLVDDEKDFAETMVALLQMRGFMVTVVHSGKDGLEKAKERPDLILLDVMMPELNGYEVCTKLKADDATKNIPVIMLTAKTQAQDKVEGLQIGADDYVTKTSDAEELFARIEAVLRRSGLSTEIDKEKSQLIEELKNIIENELVQMVFQPIYFLNPHKLFAYEVLTRGPKDSLLQNPEKLFKSALRYGMLFELELLCRKKTLEKLGTNVKENLFFFNSNPYLIEAERLD